MTIDATPKPKRRWLSCALKALLSLTGVCAIVFVTAGFLAPLSLLYKMKATYVQMPSDDHQLENWLKAQRGVVPNTVHISRKDHTVRIYFITEGSAFWRAPFPNLPKACESLGYKEAVSEWADDWAE